VNIRLLTVSIGQEPSRGARREATTTHRLLRYHPSDMAITQNPPVKTQHNSPTSVLPLVRRA